MYIKIINPQVSLEDAFYMYLNLDFVQICGNMPVNMQKANTITRQMEIIRIDPPKGFLTLFLNIPAMPFVFIHSADSLVLNEYLNEKSIKSGFIPENYQNNPKKNDEGWHPLDLNINFTDII